MNNREAKRRAMNAKNKPVTWAMKIDVRDIPEAIKKALDSIGRPGSNLSLQAAMDTLPTWQQEECRVIYDEILALRWSFFNLSQSGAPLILPVDITVETQHGRSVYQLYRINYQAEPIKHTITWDATFRKVFPGSPGVADKE